MTTYSITEFNDKEFVIELDDIDATDVDIEKLIKSINIPTKPSRRIQYVSTKEHFIMLYPSRPNPFIIKFNFKTTATSLQISFENNVGKDILAIEAMLKSHLK